MVYIEQLNKGMKKRDSKTSALSRQPGRFALVDLEKPFVHRVRHQKARGKLHALLSKNMELLVRVLVF